MKKFISSNIYNLNNFTPLSFTSNFYRVYKFSYLEKKIKEDKFSFDFIKNLIEKMILQNHRTLDNFPKEFLKFKETLLELEKPTEPDDFECCGKGCSPCVWDRFDTNMRKYEETVQFLYEKVNEDT